MTTFRKQLFSALASGALLLNIVTPVAATTDITITGNAADSTNTSTVNLDSAKTVVQSNTAVVTNTVNSTASTGGNDANYNTGGDTTIWTGNATTDVSITNELNKNQVSLDCCTPGDVTVNIQGNGYNSDNTATFSKSDATEVFQNNDAVVTNTVDALAKTGYNDANYNTGGSVLVKTGGASSMVDINTTANENVAAVTGGTGGTGDISMTVMNNGALSDNSIVVNLERAATVVQDNMAVVSNTVDANAKTGGNDANWNTGGDIAIVTGNALTDVTIGNLLNFNAADLDCGCLLGDVSAKIAGNGFEADSAIAANLGEDLQVFQGDGEGGGNQAILSNYLDGLAKTGYNTDGWNTGDPGADPVILTGSATSHQDITNAANMNVYGGNFGLEFGWDLGWLSSIL